MTCTCVDPILGPVHCILQCANDTPSSTGCSHEQQVRTPHQLGGLHVGRQGHCAQRQISRASAKREVNGSSSTGPPPLNTANTAGHGKCGGRLKKNSTKPKQCFVIAW